MKSQTHTLFTLHLPTGIPAMSGDKEFPKTYEIGKYEWGFNYFDDEETHAFGAYPFRFLESTYGDFESVPRILLLSDPSVFGTPERLFPTISQRKPRRPTTGEIFFIFDLLRMHWEDAENAYNNHDIIEFERLINPIEASVRELLSRTIPNGVYRTNNFELTSFSPSKPAQIEILKNPSEHGEIRGTGKTSGEFFYEFCANAESKGECIRINYDADYVQIKISYGRGGRRRRLSTSVYNCKSLCTNYEREYLVSPHILLDIIENEVLKAKTKTLYKSELEIILFDESIDLKLTPYNRT